MGTTSAEDFALLFGKRLRDLRISNHLSQGELGRLAGLHRTYVGAVERGEKNISLSTANRMAEALGVSLPTLVDVKLNGSKST